MVAFAEDCLEEKCILITGGLVAIGRAAVTRLLDHSARVAINDIMPEDEAQAIGRAAKWPAARCISAQT